MYLSFYLSDFLDHLTQRPLHRYIFSDYVPTRISYGSYGIIFLPSLTTVPFFLHAVSSLEFSDFRFLLWFLDLLVVKKKLWVIVPSAFMHTFLPMPKYLFVGKICHVMERKGTWAKRKLAKTEDLLPTKDLYQVQETWKFSFLTHIQLFVNSLFQTKLMPYLSTHSNHIKKVF